MDCSDTNLFDNIDTLRRSLLGRTLLGTGTGHSTSQKDLANVFLIKTTLSGLGDSKEGSDNSRPSWLRRIWTCIVRKVATHSRTTHWAVEIRDDLYETFRHKEYRLLWQWRATLKLTVADDITKQPQRKEVERVLVGSTALSNAEIAERGIPPPPPTL